ncbi:MAG: hypothetical protein WBB45_18370 [Cyclobacteriaceae bacterium]
MKPAIKTFTSSPKNPLESFLSYSIRSTAITGGTPNQDQDYTKNYLISGGGEIPEPPIYQGEEKEGSNQ